MSNQAVYSAVVEAVRVVKGINVPANGREINLIVYEIDSLDLVEMGMIVEERLGIEIDADNFVDVETLGDVIGSIDQMHEAATS